MDEASKDRLAINAANATKMARNWVMTASGAAFAIYLALPLEQQQALIAHLPVQPWLLPIVASVLGILARIWPQKSITPEVAAAKSDSDQPVPSSVTPREAYAILYRQGRPGATDQQVLDAYATWLKRSAAKA